MGVFIFKLGLFQIVYPLLAVGLFFGLAFCYVFGQALALADEEGNVDEEALDDASESGLSPFWAVLFFALTIILQALIVAGAVNQTMANGNVGPNWVIILTGAFATVPYIYAFIVSQIDDEGTAENMDNEEGGSVIVQIIMTILAEITYGLGLVFPFLVFTPLNYVSGLLAV